MVAPAGRISVDLCVSPGGDIILVSPAIRNQLMHKLARSPSQQDVPSHGLVSLWGMLNFNAEAFYRAVISLRTMRLFMQNESLVPKNEREQEVGESFLSSLRPSVGPLRVACEMLVVPSTADAVERLSKALDFRGNSYRHIEQLVRDVEMRLMDDLKRVNMVVLDQSRVHWFSDAESRFGTDVQSKFQSALFEIDEAGKCFALDRWTASVFHLMRVMEINVQAVARCLRIPDPVKQSQRNWGHILKAVDEAIDAKKGNWAIAADEEFFGGVHILLDRVRNHWRNATMHVENKYTEEEAKDILEAVFAFTRKLASRLDEDGKPLA